MKRKFINSCQTGRISSSKPNKANTPRKGVKASRPHRRIREDEEPVYRGWRDYGI